MFVRQFPFGMCIAYLAIISHHAVAGDEIGARVFINVNPAEQSSLLDDLLQNPPTNPDFRGIDIDIVQLNNTNLTPPNTISALKAIGFKIAAKVGSGGGEAETPLDHEVYEDAIDNGADYIHFEENLHFQNPNLADGNTTNLDVDKWVAIWDTVKAADENVQVGLTEADGLVLEAAIDAIIDAEEDLPEFAALVWLVRTGATWHHGSGALNSNWTTFDSFLDAMRQLGISTGMWVGDFREGIAQIPFNRMNDTFPSRFPETYYKCDMAFAIQPTSDPDETGPLYDEEDEHGNPAFRDEIEKVTGPRLSIRDVNDNEVAFLNDNGDLVVGGGWLTGTYSKSISAFEVHDSSAVAVSLLDADGDFWADDTLSEELTSAQLDDLYDGAGEASTAIWDDQDNTVGVFRNDGLVGIKGKLFENAR